MATDWQEFAAPPISLDIVTRLALRVFLGEELCRDEDQLRVSKGYAIDMFIAAAVIRLAHLFSRKVLHYYLPPCRKLRALKAEVRRRIYSVLEKRRRIERTNCAADRPVLPYNDTLEWGEKEAKTRNVTLDQATFQLGMSMAAAHTTSDLFAQVMLDLAQHPEMFQPLREEIIRSDRGGGWTKSSVYDKKLLDSVIKESQRMKPLSSRKLLCYTSF